MNATVSYFKTIKSEADAQIHHVSVEACELLARVPTPPLGMDHLVYCDGACKGNPGPGGWGVVLISTGEPGAQLGQGVSAQTTNNKMELTAAIEALKQVPSKESVLVRTDSQYVIKGCTEWRKGWVRNGMRNGKKEPVANSDLWQLLWAEVDARTVKFEWVRGHNGDPGNELADLLAVAHNAAGK
jgi:ribonuclease HI